MKQIEIKTAIQVYDSMDELPEVERQLLQKAHDARNHSYAPYSKFKVGAAILLNNEEVLLGGNQENASYPLCLCAERVAIAAAESQFPNTPIKLIAVTAKSFNKVLDQPVSPCGACRQVICEMEYRYKQDMKVILQGEKGKIFVLQSGKDLLPLSFDGSAL